MTTILRRLTIVSLLLLALGVAGCCLTRHGHGPGSCGQPCQMKVEDCQKCAPNCQTPCPNCPCKMPAGEAPPVK